MPPASGIRPIRANISPKRARSDAMTRSHARARLQPAPAAAPSTMAIVGARKRASARIARLIASTRVWPSAAVMGLSRMNLTSPPAQKCSPAPRTTRTRTCASPARAVSASSSSRRIAMSSALRTSGRFSVSVAMPSVHAVRTVRVSDVM